jgi:metal-responsive CopG/Arc/MetJ family transcriptional regulator
MPLQRQEIELCRQLVERLERLSADSAYAHRASGVKGSLLRYLEGEAGDEEGSEELERLMAMGFEILEKAAGEIVVQDFEEDDSRT